MGGVGSAGVPLTFCVLDADKIPAVQAVPPVVSPKAPQLAIVRSTEALELKDVDTQRAAGFIPPGMSPGMLAGTFNVPVAHGNLI